MGKLSRDYIQQKVGLAFLTITGTSKNKKKVLLVEPSSILLPPLHITLGLINFVWAVDQTEPEFRYLTEKLPGISIAKMIEGVFISQQICKLFRDRQCN
jgi:hypothetical protein